MAEPNNRAEFIQYCLNRLGAPVINIEMDPSQSDQAVDDALTTFREFHYDAQLRTYYKHQVTSEDLVNYWIPCSDDIQSVIRVVQWTDNSSLSIFDIRYQLRLQDFYNFSNVSMQHYYITMQKLDLIDFLLNPEPSISFNRFMNQIFLNIDWAADVSVGDYLIFEVFQRLDELQFPRIFHDRWLKNYATELMRRQWGSNLKKFRNVATLGGITLDGQQIYDEASAKILLLEQELHDSYQQPARIFIG